MRPPASLMRRPSLITPQPICTGVNVTRKQFLALLTAASARAQSTGKTVNDDDHGMKLANVNGPTANMEMAAPLAAAASPLQAVTTRSGSNLRHGTYLHETRLTPAVVRGGLRKLFSMKMPGDQLGMEAQPLFMPSVRLANGATHDLCVCATMANAIYGFDAKPARSSGSAYSARRSKAPGRSM